MPGKDPKEYDLDEVCLFLNAIGLESKAAAFRENAVDGTMLVTLQGDDFKELGLSSLQAKKVQRSVEFCQQLANESSARPAGEADDGSDAMIAQLEAENAKLKKEVAELKSVLQALQSPPAPAPAPKAAPPPPQQTYYHQPPPPRHEAYVVKGAARGATRGTHFCSSGRSNAASLQSFRTHDPPTTCVDVRFLS